MIMPNSNVLTTESIIGCPHFIPAAPPQPAQGQVQFAGTINYKLKVKGKSVLLQKDINGASVNKCPNPNSGNTSKQCTMVSSVISGQATKLMVNKSPVMLGSLVGDTDGFPPTPPLPPAGDLQVVQVQSKLKAS
jgi:hypothetical protein